MREEMHEVEANLVLRRLLHEYSARGGVLDFIFLECQHDGSPEELHRSAALAGMAVIDRRYEEHVRRNTPHAPIENRFRVGWDATRLIGEQVSFETFWGSDNASIISGVVPNVDGYKTAFFLPPYSLRGTEQEHEQLLAQINVFVLGPDPRACEIYSWCTDWSNYFDAGKEWWGAFFWTLRQPGSDVFTVIGASTTD